LDLAERLMDEFEQQAEALSSSFPASRLAGPETPDFRCYASERIMGDTYRALNQLEMGNLSDAGAALTRAHKEQQEAVAQHQFAAARSMLWPHQLNSYFNEDAASQDPQFLQSYDRQYGPLKQQDLSGYSDYFNPFSEYLYGLYWMMEGATADERKQAAPVLKRVAEITDNAYIAQDAGLAARGDPVPSTTYVIFEAGIAPTRDEAHISYPLILDRTQKPHAEYVDAVFPVLVTHECKTGELTVVTTDGVTYPSAMICDMDKVVAAEFKQELPILVTATLISSAVSRIDLEEVDNAMDAATLNDPLIRSIMKAIRNHVIEDFTHADTHSWRTLPKMFSVAELLTPRDRRISLTFSDGQKLEGINLQDGVNFVWVKTLDTWSIPRIVGQFNLK
jgi:uncharacterized protein